eukprot:m51a1_g5757 hypothetical protein (460) ;mRNA; f:1208312-1209691
MSVLVLAAFAALLLPPRASAVATCSANLTNGDQYPTSLMFDDALAGFQSANSLSFKVLVPNLGSGRTYTEFSVGPVYAAPCALSHGSAVAIPATACDEYVIATYAWQNITACGVVRSLDAASMVETYTGVLRVKYTEALPGMSEIDPEASITRTVVEDHLWTVRALLTMSAVVGSVRVYATVNAHPLFTALKITVPTTPGDPSLMLDLLVGTQVPFWLDNPTLDYSQSTHVASMTVISSQQYMNSSSHHWALLTIAVTPVAGVTSFAQEPWTLNFDVVCQADVKECPADVASANNHVSASLLLSSGSFVPQVVSSVSASAQISVFATPDYATAKNAVFSDDAFFRTTFSDNTVSLSGAVLTAFTVDGQSISASPSQGTFDVANQDLRWSASLASVSGIPAEGSVTVTVRATILVTYTTTARRSAPRTEKVVVEKQFVLNRRPAALLGDHAGASSNTPWI